jgi:hypothetical protein
LALSSDPANRKAASGAAAASVVGTTTGVVVVEPNENPPGARFLEGGCSESAGLGCLVRFLEGGCSEYAGLGCLGATGLVANENSGFFVSSAAGAPFGLTGFVVAPKENAGFFVSSVFFCSSPKVKPLAAGAGGLDPDGAGA